MNRSDQDSFVDALRAADPGAHVTVTDTVALSAVHRVQSGVHESQRPLGLWATIAIVVAAIAVPAGAVASGFAAHTGWFGSPNPEATSGTDWGTEADGSEWLDVTAPDFVDAATLLMPEYITLPTGFDTGRFARAISTDIRDGILNGPDADTVREDGALMQVTGVVAMYEIHAQCVWRREWLAAFDSNDARRAETAASVLALSAIWPATVASDGGGVVDNEERLAAAAAMGDRQTVATDGMLNCPPLPNGADR